MTTLEEVVELAGREQHLAVISTLRADQTIQSSLVNAGVLAHPISGQQVMAFATYGRAKLANLRQRPQLSVTFRAGWQWAAIEGDAELIGPGDPHPAIDAEGLRVLLRAIFVAAGGSHDDWDAYDAEMVRSKRAAVLIVPKRIYSN